MGRLPTAAIVALAVALPLTFARRARAEGTASLAWVRGEGAEQCPDASALRTAVNTRAGRDAIVDGGRASVEAIVTAGTGTARWSARLFVRDPAGTLLGRRDLTSDAPGCAPLVDIVAFAIVVALDADASGVPPGPIASSGPPAPVDPAPAPTPRMMDDERPPILRAGTPTSPFFGPPTSGTGASGRSDTSVRASFGVRGDMDIGMQPTVAPGGSVVIDVVPGGWPTVRAVLTYWPESRTAQTTSTMPTVGVRYDLATLLVCPPLVRVEGLRIEVCGGVAGGVMTGAGHGFTTNIVADRPFFAVEAGVAIRQAIGPIYLEGGVDAVVPTPHYDIAVDNMGTVWSPTVLAGHAFAGVGVLFR